MSNFKCAWSAVISTQATKRPKLADYDFVEEPLEEFYCPVTFELLLEPHQTLCCGNHLSQEAAKRLKGKPCPMCNKRKFGTVPDKFFQRKVNAVKVLCAHKSLGCEWVGELGNLDGHQSQNSVEEECQFVTVACPYSCGDDLQRCQLEGHKANDCPNRPFTCPYCDHKATFIEVTNEHLSLCRNDCPNKSLGCQWAGRRGDLDQHLKGEGGCQYAEVACEFSYLGCKAKVPRLILQAHLTENVKSHLTMLAKHLQQKSDHQQHMIVQLLDTITKQLQTIATQQQAIAKQQQAIAKHQQNFKALTSRMHNITMNEFMKYKQTDGIWISPPFYSSFGGYKMCLMVYGNGDGEYKGIRISQCLLL